MSTSFVTVEQYRTATGDQDTPDDVLGAKLPRLSAKLRAMAGISSQRTLTEDQRLMCEDLVIGAAQSEFVVPEIPLGESGMSMSGLTQATFSANGFSGSWQRATSGVSGTVYFDREGLRALRRSLGTAQRMGTIMPLVRGGHR